MKEIVNTLKLCNSLFLFIFKNVNGVKEMINGKHILRTMFRINLIVNSISQNKPRAIGLNINLDTSPLQWISVYLYCLIHDIKLYIFNSKTVSLERLTYLLVTSTDIDVMFTDNPDIYQPGPFNNLGKLFNLNKMVSTDELARFKVNNKILLNNLMYDSYLNTITEFTESNVIDTEKEIIIQFTGNNSHHELTWSNLFNSIDIHSKYLTCGTSILINHMDLDVNHVHGILSNLINKTCLVQNQSCIEDYSSGPNLEVCHLINCEQIDKLVERELDFLISSPIYNTLYKSDTFRQLLYYKAANRLKMAFNGTISRLIISTGILSSNTRSVLKYTDFEVVQFVGDANRGQYGTVLSWSKRGKWKWWNHYSCLNERGVVTDLSDDLYVFNECVFNRSSQLIGFIDDLIVVNNKTIIVRPIIDLLKSNPFVAECTLKSNPSNEKELILYIRLDIVRLNDSNQNISDVYTYFTMMCSNLSSKLTNYGITLGFRLFTNSFPKDANSKIIKELLP
jgi:hypothetical protein